MRTFCSDLFGANLTKPSKNFKLKADSGFGSTHHLQFDSFELLLVRAST